MIRARNTLAFLLAVCLGVGGVQADAAAPPDGAGATKSEEKATLEDGERDWGRDPGIGTTLTPTSMVLAGLGSTVVLCLVLWMVFYQKPDGTVHPYDD